MKRLFLGSLLLASVMSLTGFRSFAYSAYEQFGVHKRDLLKKRVVVARDEEERAQQELKDALTRARQKLKNPTTPAHHSSFATCDQHTACGMIINDQAADLAGGT